MTKQLAWSLTIATFLSYWILAHLIYAFIMLDWSAFTQWEPVTRGVNLALSLYLTATVGFIAQSRVHD